MLTKKHNKTRNISSEDNMFWAEPPRQMFAAVRMAWHFQNMNHSFPLNFPSKYFTKAKHKLIPTICYLHSNFISTMPPPFNETWSSFGSPAGGEKKPSIPPIHPWPPVINSATNRVGGRWKWMRAAQNSGDSRSSIFHHQRAVIIRQTPPRPSVCWGHNENEWSRMRRLVGKIQFCHKTN